MNRILIFLLVMQLSLPAFSQNVGIGETSPQAKLDIRGSANPLQNALLVKNNSNIPLMTINNQGKTGINTINPEVPLHVYSSTFSEMARFDGFSPYISFYDGNIYSGYVWSKSVSMEVGTPLGSGRPITISPSNGVTTTFKPDGSMEVLGNVGIGVFNPVYRLEVDGRIRLRYNAETAGIWFNNSTNAFMPGFIGLLNDQHLGLYGSSGGWGLLMNTNNGNIGIGTISGTGTAKLEVRGTGTGSTALKIGNGRIQYDGAGVNTSTAVFVHKATPGTMALSGSFTVIDNPYCNNNPSAILIAVMNATYGAGTGPGYTDFLSESPSCPLQLCTATSFTVFYNGPGNYFYPSSPAWARERWCVRGYNGGLVADLTNLNFNIMIFNP